MSKLLTPVPTHTHTHTHTEIFQTINLGSLSYYFSHLGGQLFTSLLLTTTSNSSDLTILWCLFYSGTVKLFRNPHKMCFPCLEKLIQYLDKITQQLNCGMILLVVCLCNYLIDQSDISFHKTSGHLYWSFFMSLIFLFLLLSYLENHRRPWWHLDFFNHLYQDSFGVNDMILILHDHWTLLHTN